MFIQKDLCKQKGPWCLSFPVGPPHVRKAEDPKASVGFVLAGDHCTSLSHHCEAFTSTPGPASRGHGFLRDPIDVSPEAHGFFLVLIFLVLSSNNSTHGSSSAPMHRFPLNCQREPLRVPSVVQMVFPSLSLCGHSHAYGWLHHPPTVTPRR